MHSRIIKPESNGRKYPCLVIDAMCGDGSEPTVYMKPDKFVSVVVVAGVYCKQVHYGIGHVIDSRAPEVIADHGFEEGEGIHEDLPLFLGEVILENGGV